MQFLIHKKFQCAQIVSEEKESQFTDLQMIFSENAEESFQIIIYKFKDILKRKKLIN